MDALIQHFQRMARYNQVANSLLYGACEHLSADVFTAPRLAFFSSIQGVLNHIMTGDRIWLARFEGKKAPSTNLDALLYADFTSLHATRIEEDKRILLFADSLTPDFLAGDISYLNNQGRTMQDPVTVLVAHFFNHQTHHRGQAHDLLSQTDVAPPSLDMHRCLNP